MLLPDNFISKSIKFGARNLKLQNLSNEELLINLYASRVIVTQTFCLKVV